MMIFPGPGPARFAAFAAADAPLPLSFVPPPPRRNPASRQKIKQTVTTFTRGAAALKALRLRYFMDTKDWADHLSEAGVKCTANDLRNIVFGAPGLKGVLADAENAYGVYMRTCGRKRYYQVLDGGPCDESLRGLESPTPRSRFLRDAALRRSVLAP